MKLCRAERNLVVWKKKTSFVGECLYEQPHSYTNSHTVDWKYRLWISKRHIHVKLFNIPTGYGLDKRTLHRVAREKCHSKNKYNTSKTHWTIIMWAKHSVVCYFEVPWWYKGWRSGLRPFLHVVVPPPCSQVKVWKQTFDLTFLDYFWTKVFLQLVFFSMGSLYVWVLW